MHYIEMEYGEKKIENNFNSLDAFPTRDGSNI